jgi:hypothetical protein
MDCIPIFTVSSYLCMVWSLKKDEDDARGINSTERVEGITRCPLHEHWPHASKVGAYFHCYTIKSLFAA